MALSAGLISLTRPDGLLFAAQALYHVVGPNSIIASGSVVNNDIPQNSVYGGVPAKFISSLEDFLEKSKKRNTGNFSSKDTKRKKRILLNKFGHLL